MSRCVWVVGAAHSLCEVFLAQVLTFTSSPLSGYFHVPNDLVHTTELFLVALYFYILCGVVGHGGWLVPESEWGRLSSLCDRVHVVMFVCVNCCVLVFFVRRTEPEMRKNSPHYYRWTDCISFFCSVKQLLLVRSRIPINAYRVHEAENTSRNFLASRVLHCWMFTGAARIHALYSCFYSVSSTDWSLLVQAKYTLPGL